MKLIILLTVVVGISAAGTPETYRRLGLRGSGGFLGSGRYGHGGNFNNGRIVITDGARSLSGGQYLVGGGLGGRAVVSADGNRYIVGGGLGGAGRFINDGAGRILVTRGGGGRFQLVGTGGAVDVVDSSDDDDGGDVRESSSGSSTVVVSTGGSGTVTSGGVIPVSRRVFPATGGTFPTVSRGIVPISSGTAGVNVNFQGPIVDVTDQPTYFTTTRYGPVSSGGIRGSGERSSSVDFTRSGTATGTLFSNDNAEATETAKKTVGYEYNYNEGYDYTQPRTLYSYDLREPIWGFADNAFHYTGDAAVGNGGAVTVNGNGRIAY